MTRLIRGAERNDALHVAAIVDMAGHGIDMQAWQSDSDDDQSVLAAARRAAVSDPWSAYHYSRAFLAEIDGEIAGGIVGELLSAVDQPEKPATVSLAPLIALETRLPGYWSILAVATYAEFRGRGLAAALLAHVEAIAVDCGALGLCLAVEDTNLSAMSIYAAAGFEATASLPWIAYGRRTGPRHWVLMKKDFAAL